MRNAVPLLSTETLPEVWPSLGVRAVSPEIISTRDSGRSSSSAAICASAVRMPCPSSTLPVKTVALPSALMRIQASSRRLPCKLPGSRSWPRADLGSSEKATTSAPRAVVNSRRLKTGAFTALCPPVRVRRPQHRTNDACVGAATAKIPGERRAHVCLGRPRIAIEQLFRRHDHAIDAVAALGRLLLHEGTLQWMRFIQRADAFDGRDLASRYRADRRDAGTRRLAVDEHGASAALRQPAAKLRAIELEVVAKHVKQRRVRLGRNRTAHAIDFDVDGHAWRLPAGRRPEGQRRSPFLL